MIPLPLIFGNHVFPPAVKKFRKIPELVGDGHDNVGEGEIVHALDPVPVVHVPVQDEDTLEAVNRDCVLGRNGHVVE